MNIWSNNLFYIIFLGQILLTSYFLPKLILGRMDRLLATYPPSTHPKLYPRPVEYYRIGRSAFLWANRIILALGFGVLYLVHSLDPASIADDGYISEAWPAVYGFIQFLPLMALEVLGFGQLRRMREANTDSRRKAELRPRRLFAYVSPGLLAASVALVAAVIGLDLYVNEFTLAWGSDAVQRDLVLVGTNAFLLAMGVWYLSGRKLDPHQSAVDRANQVKAQLTSLLLVSMTMSVYFMTQTADDAFGIDYLDAPLMSLYFQMIVVVSIGFVLRSLKFEDIDFSVYTSDDAPARRDAQG